MNLNLTTPAKAGLGASAAAGTSLAAAGAGGAFSSGVQLEKVEGDKENLIEESANKDEVDNSKQPQTVNEDPQEIQTSTDKAPDLVEKQVDSVPESTPKDSFYSEDNFKELKKSSKPIKFVSQNQTQKYEAGTIGQRYSRFLVSVSGDAESGNIDWWNEKYTEKYENNSDEGDGSNQFKPFKTSKEIKKGYDKNLSADSLNGLCHSFYNLKQTTEEIKQIPSNFDKSESYSIWAGLWGFCSPEKYDPYYIEDNSSNYKPKQTDNVISYPFKNKLLSTAEEITDEEEETSTEIDNKFIWEKLNYHFFETEEVEDLYFKSFKDSNSPLKSGTKSLKNKCEAAYKIKNTIQVGINRPSNAALLKYCSLND